MAYTFLKAQGFEIGKSLVEEDRLAMARDLLEKAKAKGVEFLLPSDHNVAETFAADSPAMIAVNGSVPGNWDGT